MKLVPRPWTSWEKVRRWYSARWVLPSWSLARTDGVDRHLTQVVFWGERGTFGERSRELDNTWDHLCGTFRLQNPSVTKKWWAAKRETFSGLWGAWKQTFKQQSDAETRPWFLSLTSSGGRWGGLCPQSQSTSGGQARWVVARQQSRSTLRKCEINGTCAKLSRVKLKFYKTFLNIKRVQKDDWCHEIVLKRVKGCKIQGSCVFNLCFVLFFF